MEGKTRFKWTIGQVGLIILPRNQNEMEQETDWERRRQKQQKDV